MTNIQSFLDTVVERQFDVSETEHLLKATNINVWYSWGVEKISYYRKKDSGDALALWVTGHHHTGCLIITLGWNDTYTYYLLNQDNTVKKKVTDVYFDELQHRIDLDIEYISDYEF
ncbi:hypothetical protein [Flavobacterium sp.]|uniref:hypothetical protein n=1 Tax=Flavobacterium sp. TaxID=239 RepID=UPI00403402B9